LKLQLVIVGQMGLDFVIMSTDDLLHLACGDRDPETTIAIGILLALVPAHALVTDGESNGLACREIMQREESSFVYDLK
jgi:hypothetical protein